MHRHNPAAIHAPLGGYSHSIRVPAGTELLFLSGQVGIDRDGNVAEGMAAQTRQTLANLVACLTAEGLTVRDLVKLTILLTDAGAIDEMRRERNAVLGTAALPTSTLMVVSALARPDLLVEIEAIAARSSAPAA